VPALFLVHALLTRGHDSVDALCDLPEELAVCHFIHAFLIREICWLSSQFREVCFVTCASLAVTEDAVAFASFEVKGLSFFDRFSRRDDGILRFVSIFRKFPRILREVLLWRACARLNRAAIVLIAVFVGGNGAVCVLRRRRYRNVERSHG